MDIQQLSSPTVSTSFLPPQSESANRPQNIPVMACAAVLAETIIPACVEIVALDAEGSKNLS